MADKTTYIKIDRNIERWRWYQDANTMRVFLHLLLHANVSDYDFKAETIHRGELATSIGNIAATLKITYNQARTAISHLKETKEITTRVRPKYLVISITNYDWYQTGPTQNTSKTQANHKQITSRPQQYKNYKNEKNENNLNTPPKVAPDLEDYGGIFLSPAQWDELEAAIGPSAMIEYVDKVAAWLEENPRQKRTHINVLKKFLRNDGLIK